MVKLESYTLHVQDSDNVGNERAWGESASVAIEAVTKYYHHGSSRVAMRQGGEVYYLYGDHLGSTSLTTDDQGSVVHEARYLPFGEERWVDGEGVTDFGYTGQRNEGYMELMEMGARWYDPTVGRWLSPDTIIPDPTNPQSLNRYAYGYNNPVKFRDPSGHEPCKTTWGDCPPPRPSVQPIIDTNNKVNNGLVWPLAIAGRGTTISQVDDLVVILPENTARSIGTVKMAPKGVLMEGPSRFAQTATAFSYGLPVVGGALNAMETQLRADTGEITAEEATKQQAGNVVVTVAASVGGGYAIPTAAAATSNPVGWSVIGGLSLGYDLSIAQGTYNNVVEGQPFNEALLNARAETHRSFGIEGFDAAASTFLEPILIPVLTPIAKMQYSR